MKLKIMTFNIRYGYADDGINAFENRKPRIIEMIRKESPDIIGFQEVLPFVRKWIIETFPEYYAVGAGREARYEGESALIAYKKMDFQLVACESKMLSPTPFEPGSRYEDSDQSGCPRVYTKLLLMPDNADEPFCVYNVHTDHVGVIARKLETEQLLQDICSCDYKFVLTGDFNATPETAEIKVLTENKARKIIDATENIGATFHGYGTRANPPKIDYIFVGESVKVLSSGLVPDERKGGIYQSDHYAVTAEIEI